MAGNVQSGRYQNQQNPHLFAARGVTPNHFSHSNPPMASPILKLTVTGLPPQTSTLDIYENFCRHGSLVRIELYETERGSRSTRAEVVFEPAPTNEFWRHSFDFETRSQQSATVTCQVQGTQNQKFLKESPTRKGVKYEDRMEINGTALEFGVLTEPTSMMVMGQSGDMQPGPILLLNLHRKEIEIKFPWRQISVKRSSVRTFRFLIALDNSFKLWQLPDRSLIFHLDRPPWYSKQLAEAIGNTHSPDARLWTIEDTWARQTDIWTYKQCIPDINGSPVALQKHLNDINISRWTTFRFILVNNSANFHIAQNILAALRDWNIKVLDGTSFQVSEAEEGLDKKVWGMINDTHYDKSKKPLAADPPPISLPFSVRYQLEVCLSQGWLSEYSINFEFMKQLSEWPEAMAKQALIFVATDQKRLFDPTVIFKDLQYSKPVRAKQLPDSCIEVCSATVTATGILFHTPAVEITNRIIRNHKSHAHRFLRVRFEDDDYRGQTKIYPSTNNKMVMIFERVKRAMTNGIELGNILYEFLAWGNSQIREHGAYFFAAEDGLTADSIRAEMGHFKELVVAKKAARMGQCFSTTRPVRLPLKVVKDSDAIDDIVRNNYTFTDGVGMISPEAAKLVASQLHIKGPTPCLFQFRLGGCKGVLAVSNDVPGVGVVIRKSQLKFNSFANELEINRWAQFWQAYLNRQIILCLSSLGVPTEVFIRKQSETISELNQAMHNDGTAINALRSSIDPNMMTLRLSNMVEAGFRSSQEPFVVSLLELWRTWSLKYLKEKAKIPVKCGAFVLGTVDETATLQGHTSNCPSGDSENIQSDPTSMEKLPEIFVQITDHKTGKLRIIEGICILARNPSLHRGDIRVVRARDVPALHHMVDVVVVPQLGERPLPSMCSGGDLDGDDYIVIWDKDLIPKFWNAEPFHYEAPSPKIADGEIKTSDLISFFLDYMQNDALGKIAHAHLAAADRLDDGLESSICLELVQLHSMAVDYPKTGIPAKMERRLEMPRKPHFMEPKFGKSYPSYKVLGQLYNEINKFYDKIQPNEFVKLNLEFDCRILDAFDPSPELVRKVQIVKHEYDISLRRALTQHSIRTEFELWSTFVLEHSKKSHDYKFHEEVGELSRVLKEEYYEAMCKVAGGQDFDHLAPVAVTAYRLTRDQLQTAKDRAKAQQGDGNPIEMPFISFPWILQDTLIKIASQTESRSRPNVAETNVQADNSVKNVGDSIDEGTVDKLYDVTNFKFTRTKLSPYLSDPVLSHPDVPTAETKEGRPARASLKCESNPSADTQHQSVPAKSTAAHHGNQDLAAQDGDSSTNDMDPAILSNASKSIPGACSGISPTGSKVDDHPVMTQASSFYMDKHVSQNMPPIVGISESKSPLSLESRHKLTSAYVPYKQRTCCYWRSGHCKYSDQECKFGHYETGRDMPVKQQVTCYFWYRNGKCEFSEEKCKFAHHDTGYYASRPVGCVSSKGRNPSTTKRVLAQDSDSDDHEFTVPLRKTSGGQIFRAGPKKYEQISRKKAADEQTSPSDAHCDQGFSKFSCSEDDLRNHEVSSKQATYLFPTSRSHASANQESGNDNIRNYQPQNSPTKSRDYRRANPSNRDFHFPSRTAYTNSAPRQLAKEQPVEQLVDLLGENEGTSRSMSGYLNPFQQREHVRNHDWVNDLKDLVFDREKPILNDQESLKPAQSLPAQVRQFANGDSEPLPREVLINTTNSELTDDSRTPCVADVDDPDKLGGTSSLHGQSNHPENSMALEFNGTAKTSSPPSSANFQTSSLTGKYCYGLKQNKHEREQDTIPVTEPSVTQADRFYDDPLTSGDNEPDIEELFD